MSKDTDNSLFINFSLPRFYQQLISGMVSYEVLGNHIIRKIKGAHVFRRVEEVKELSRLLLSIPIKEYQTIGHYYIVWCDGRASKYNSKALEHIIEQTRGYKTEAMSSLAAFEGYQGRINASLYYYAEALKTSPTISNRILIIRSVAALKSFEGFHDRALNDLESLVPFIKHAEPLVYYDCLNSYATELGIAGRKQEARNISSIVLASPFAYAYPEWQETANDLKPTSRSFAVIRPTRIHRAKILRMPLVERSEPTEVGRLAPVVSLPDWKKKMGKGKKGNGDKKKPVDEMTEREMFFEIMQIYSSGETTDDQRRRIFEAVVSIMSEPDKPEPGEPKPDEPDGA